MTGLELVGAFLVGWAVRKARRVGTRVDGQVDEVLDEVVDAGLDRLHTLVSDRLGGDPAVVRFEEEAAAGAVGERTQARVQLAVEQAAEDDSVFASAVAAVVQELSQHPQAAGVTAAGTRSNAVGGNQANVADRGSAAAGTMGDVRIGGVPPDPSRPGSQAG